MIYLDTSVVLAKFFVEDVQPHESIWNDVLLSSRLLEYEVWNRMNNRSANKELRQATLDFFSGIEWIEMTPDVLERALDPFPKSIRTSDSLHLATLYYLREQQRLDVELASYDKRMLLAAEALGFPCFPMA